MYCDTDIGGDKTANGICALSGATAGGPLGRGEGWELGWVVVQKLGDNKEEAEWGVDLVPR